MAEPQQRSPVNFSLRSILVGVMCLVLAHLALAGLQTAFDLPGTIFIQQSIATACGVIAWFFVGGKLGT